MKDMLLKWYATEKRTLPWRSSKSPYDIWLSEIMLQQTRVDQGIGYYYRFLEAFPDVFSLANASENEVLKLWQGLGYYSRARNLHHTAHVIVKDYQGHFPPDYASLVALKGIGPYTAAAIASIAFNQPYPVCDGNVERVVCRLLAIKEAPKQPATLKTIHQFLEKNIDRQQPGDFNQAMMELGALVCKPSSPDCPHCPLQNQCKALKLKLTASIPLRVKKEQNPRRYFYYLIIQTNGNSGLWIRKRSGNDIWKGLYDFPLIETSAPVTAAALKKTEDWKSLFGEKVIAPLKQSKIIHHKLTHRELLVKFVHLEIKKSDFSGEGYNHIKLKELSQYPVPQLIANYIRDTLL